LTELQQKNASELEKTKTMTSSAELIAAGQNVTELKKTEIATGSAKEIAAGQNIAGLEKAKIATESAEKIAKDADQVRLAIAKGENVAQIRIAQIKADADALAADAKMRVGTPVDVVKLREEYIKGAGRYISVLDQAARFNALDAVNSPRGITDDAMIRLYHKMLDPQSVVRETEYGQVFVTDSVTNQLIRSYNKAVDGTLLGPPGSRLRGDVADTIGRLVLPFRALKETHEDTYRRLAGVYADTVVIPLTAQEGEAGVSPTTSGAYSPPPSAGTPLSANDVAFINKVRQRLQEGYSEEAIRADLKANLGYSDEEIGLWLQEARR
jgi:hypothetical protein